MAVGDKPIKDFRAGSVRASIWRDELVSQGAEPREVFSVRVERRYKDAAGSWQSSTRFNRLDLADLEPVAFKAREFLSVKQREPGHASFAKPWPGCKAEEVTAMEVEFFDSQEAAERRLRQAMLAADARVRPWQAALRVGDCFVSLAEEGLAIFGEVLESYSERRLRPLREG